MKVFVSGSPQEIREGARVCELAGGVRGLRRVAAIWVNDRPLSKEEYTAYVLQDGDEVRIQRLEMGG